MSVLEMNMMKETGVKFWRKDTDDKAHSRYLLRTARVGQLNWNCHLLAHGQMDIL